MLFITRWNLPLAPMLRYFARLPWVDKSMGTRYGGMTPRYAQTLFARVHRAFCGGELTGREPGVELDEVAPPLPYIFYTLLIPAPPSRVPGFS